MLHIASAIVKARPIAQAQLVTRIAAFAGAEVVAAEQGRIIVVLKAGNHGALADTLHCIAGLDGVLSATLIFGYSKPDGEAA